MKSTIRRSQRDYSLASWEIGATHRAVDFLTPFS